MIEYIKGEIQELTPTYAIIEASNIGYYIHISLICNSQLQNQKNTKLFIHEIIREDAHLLFGFIDKAERDIFLLLISVSGVGANTARVIQSKFETKELQQIIASGDAKSIQSVKGIGAKTAQRLIVDLKEKVCKIDSDLILSPTSSSVSSISNTNVSEALNALTTLGFQANASKKALEQLVKKDPTLSVEQLVKLALKHM